MRKNSIKNIRINEEVKRELTNIIRNEVKDPRIHPMTSVLSAEVTADLKYCKVSVSVLGTEEEAQATLEGLKSATKFIRNQLARSVNLRNTPEITFVLNPSIEYGIHISRILDSLDDLHEQDPDAETEEEIDE